MNTLTPPTLRIVGVRFRLRKHRTVRPEASAKVLDELMLGLAALAAPKSGPLTRDALAATVERAAQVGLEMARDAEDAQATRVCACGHGWGEHVAGRGCFECYCTARRPHGAEIAPAGGE